ncbi:MAG: YfcE family phosphodiesterase [Phycisphaeraceae bacterium]|nr:MAG: YfcE family phosphodiesterase [Phycisphaeraceae bacterium]
MSDGAATIELPARVLGLLSDSHGDAEMTRKAARLLLEHGAETLLHLGDVCAESVLDELAGLRAPDGTPVECRVVFGNMDHDELSMSRYAETVGVKVDHPVGRYTVVGKTAAAHHGHDPRHEPAAMRAGLDYFFHGHTHRKRDEQVGGTRFINPGALHRATNYTVALLDCASDELTFLDVPRGA